VEGFVDVAQPAARGRHVVEIEAAGGLLCIDDRRDGAEQRVTERCLERPPGELASNHKRHGHDPVIALGMIMSRGVLSIGVLPPGSTAADLTIATKHVAA
jgi:hypothetical protein